MDTNMYSRVLSVLAMLAAVSGIPAVQAQTGSGSTTPGTELGNVVASSSNSTGLQVATADAIQNTCVGLGQRDSLSDGESALFTNCSDMVLTAFALDPNLSSDLSLGWTSTQLAEGMQQLAGEEQTSTGRLATEASNGQYANLGMRLDAIRAGARATAGGINVAFNGAPLTGGNAGEDGTGWGWFLNGGFGTGDRDATVRENAYDYDSWGGTLGADYQFASGLVAGVALGYYDYQVDFDDVPSAESGQKLVNTQAGGGFDTDGYALSGYLIGNFGRFYVDGLVSYGSSDLENERIVRYRGNSEQGKGGAENRVVDRAMVGETDSDSLTVGVSTGTVFPFDWVDVSVDAGLSYLDVSVDGYTEKDLARGADTAEFSGLNLTYEDQDFDSLQSRIGLQLSRTFSFSGGVLLPYLSGAWRYEFKNDPTTVRARLAVQQEGQVFAINARSDEPDDSFFEIGVGVSAVFANNLQGFVEYRTVAGLDEISADLFSIGVRGAF
jgi:uncharacterized protein YhjY with autotransporter beta-barrel domain